MSHIAVHVTRLHRTIVCIAVRHAILDSTRQLKPVSNGTLNGTRPYIDLSYLHGDCHFIKVNFVVLHGSIQCMVVYHVALNGTRHCNSTILFISVSNTALHDTESYIDLSHGVLLGIHRFIEVSYAAPESIWQ